MNPSTPKSPKSSSWLSTVIGGRTASSPSPPPSSSNNADTEPHKKHLRGTLFKYGPKPAQVAFKTGDFNQQVIFVGGLTEGLLATTYTDTQHGHGIHFGEYFLDNKKYVCPNSLSLAIKTSLSIQDHLSNKQYLEPLSVALENEKWSLVQPLMSSSYTGYGICSLEQDSSELDQLIDYLINKEKSEGVMLLGHSTGCQDIVHYMGTNVACSKAVRGVILQAPVSDREHRATLSETATMTDLARTMISEGKALELMPRKAEPDAPITAYRYHSLCAYMGDDDMFSSDLTDEQLKSKLGHIANTPCQVIFSMADDQVPDHVDKKALVARLCKAMGGAEKVEIKWGNHTLSNRVEEAVAAILGFVKREEDPWS